MCVYALMEEDGYSQWLAVNVYNLMNAGFKDSDACSVIQGLLRRLAP